METDMAKLVLLDAQFEIFKIDIQSYKCSRCFREELLLQKETFVPDAYPIFHCIPPFFPLLFIMQNFFSLPCNSFYRKSVSYTSAFLRPNTSSISKVFFCVSSTCQNKNCVVSNHLQFVLVSNHYRCFFFLEGGF